MYANGDIGAAVSPFAYLEVEMDVVVAEGVLSNLRDYGVFKQEFERYAVGVCAQARLSPRIVEYRLRDVHLFWQDDLARVDKAEPFLDRGLDHFKQCGQLAYWLRRMSPVVEFVDLSGHYSEGDPGMNEDEKALRELLNKYGMEYLAFDWAFLICLFHERAREDGTERAATLMLSRDYITTVCHFLKSKHVSPHSLSLIFKSLLQ